MTYSLSFWLQMSEPITHTDNYMTIHHKGLLVIVIVGKSMYDTRSKKFSPKNKKDLGMACHIPPLKKAKKQG